tara:strand:- start:1282 stop:1530 length:249 start_codon:yes stop_codon:yes gene_type:complete
VFEEYNRKDYHTKDVEDAVKEWGDGNVYKAISMMESKIISLKLENSVLRDRAIWEEDEIPRSSCCDSLIIMCDICSNCKEHC